MPFDLGFQPVTLGPGEDTTTPYTYPAVQSARPHAVGVTWPQVFAAGMEIELPGPTEYPRTVDYPAGGAFRVIGGDAGPYYRLSDHLGSTSLIIDSSGAEHPNSRVVCAHFGEVRSGTQSTLTDFGYTGQRHDDSTGGLMFYNARYYLPGLGRFISADSIAPGIDSQSFNRYAYVKNQPIYLIDWSGHCIDDNKNKVVDI